ncbi:hypothetical protein VF13_40975 [Nostoc linckia z16]|nr:hypothetical protein VF13_40975 [Nostoc linckia z16]
MIRRFFTLLALGIASSAVAQQQMPDGQLRLTPSVTYKFSKKWKAGIDYRYALDHDMAVFRSSMLQGYGEYKLAKKWSIEAGYRFTTSYDKDVHRLYGSLLFDQKMKDFTISSRTRYQYSTRRFNSEFMEMFPAKEYLREKITVEYNIPKCKASVSAGAEFFFDWDSEGFQYDRTRYIAAADYHLKYGNTFGLSFFYEDRYNTLKQDRYVFNVKYSLALDELLKKLRKDKKKKAVETTESTQ